MLRILHVIATLDRAGAEGQLTHLCVGLRRRGFVPSVVCLTRGGPHEATLREAGVPVAVLGKRGRFDARVLPLLMREMRRRRPHIVHTWLFTANTWGRLAARLASVRVVVASERAADVWKGPFHRSVDRALARCSDAVVVNAEAVRRFCMERIGLPEDRLHVIRNGLNLAAFDAAAARPPSPLPERRGAHLLGTVARLEEQKGIPYLIEAFRLLGQQGVDADLWIIGDGPDRPALEAQVRATAALAQRVRFLGLRRDVPTLLGLLDVFVLPSLWEGMPNAVLEAMAARRPVVATAVDGTPELVADGETGLLVPPRRPEAIAAAVERLLADSDLRRRFGEAGRARVAREFGVERMVDETVRLYTAVSRGARRR